jgi:uncharacterized tellurite resistance protein B-like protein
MRQYRTDSPEAMARIIALSMLVDGGLDKTELDVIHHHSVLEHIGISTATFNDIVQELCEDMLQSMPGYHLGRIDLDDELTERSIDAMLIEIQDPQHRKFLLRMMLAVVDADNYLSDSETILLSRAMQIWDLELTKETKQARNPNDMLTQQSSARPPSIIEMHF